MSHSVSPRLTVCVLASLRVLCAAIGAAAVAERRAAAVSDRPRREVITRSRGAAPNWPARRDSDEPPPAAAGGCWEDDRRAGSETSTTVPVIWRTPAAPAAPLDAARPLA